MDIKHLSIDNRDEFIEQNKKFIYYTCYNICNRSLNWENDDELSLGLIAFNTACDNYKEEKGDFFSYARTLIRNALIDFFRKSKNTPSLIFDNEEETMEYIDYKTSMKNFEIEAENNIRAEEIAMLTNELSQYKLNFNSLVEYCPSHKDTRDSLLNLAFQCLKEDLILKYIKEKRLLPVKEIVLYANVNRKFVEKWRRYILTLIIILSNNNYSYIKSYLKIEVGDKNEKKLS